MNHELRIKNTKGFTIIETLVAIAILMIAVAGPMVAASRAINASLYSRDQMTASFLAQETMEVIKSARANNVDSGDWLGAFSPQCMEDTSRCDISAIDDLVLNCPGNSACRVSLDPNVGYTRDGEEEGLVFGRYFYLKPVVAEPAGAVEAHVVISWNQGTIPYEIELVSVLVNENR